MRGGTSRARHGSTRHGDGVGCQHNEVALSARTEQLVGEIVVTEKKGAIKASVGAVASQR